MNSFISTRITTRMRIKPDRINCKISPAINVKNVDGLKGDESYIKLSIITSKVPSVKCYLQKTWFYFLHFKIFFKTDKKNIPG